MPSSAEHAYLFGALMGVGLFLVVVILAEGRRRLLLLSAVLAAPAGMLDALFVPGYWQPIHVVSRLLSVEGMLFSFAAGGLAVAFAIRGRAAMVSMSIRRPVAGRRYLLVSLLAMAVLAVALLAGSSVMGAGLVAMAATATICLAARPDAWRLAARGALGFGALYLVFIIGITMLLPGIATFWTGDTWGVRIADVPLEEFAWATLYGALWPLVVVSVLGLRARHGSTLPSPASRARGLSTP